MSKPYESYYVLSDEKKTRVGYALIDRGTKGKKLYRVRFRNRDGDLRERSTECSIKADAHNEATKIIEKEYEQKKENTKTKTWDEAIELIRKIGDLRDDSKKQYAKVLRAVRDTLKNTKGPKDISLENAVEFKNTYMSQPYRRSKKENAKEYERSKESCRSYIRSLRSIWEKHFGPIGLVEGNVWLQVAYPNVLKKKRVRVPKEETIQKFLQWVENKYPKWRTLRLYLEVKMISGCRTLDLCKIKSSALQDGYLVFEGTVTKTREERKVKLAPEMYAELEKLSGPTWLWERCAVESMQYRPSKKIANESPFRPEPWRHTIQNLFREFNEGKAKEDQVRAHDLRARAITLVVKQVGSVDLAAKIIGVTPQTVRHYLDADKAWDIPTLQQKAAEILMPKPTKKIK